MQKKNITSINAQINMNDNTIHEKEIFISDTYKQVDRLKEDIIDSNLIIKSLRDRLKQFNIQVPENLDVIPEEAIDASTETNFVSKDNPIEDLKQIAENATFGLNTLKDIIKMQKDKIQKLQDILNQDLSKKIEQNNKEIEILTSKSKELNVQLPSDLTKKSEISVLKTNNLPIDKLDILEFDNILKRKSTQINNLQEIIKKQDSQIKQLKPLIDENLPAGIKHKNIEIENLNKTVKDNNKKIEMFVSKLKELNVQLPNELTEQIKIPEPKFGDHSLSTIFELRSEQIKDLNEIIKKQDSQITRLSKELNSILVETAEEKYSQLTSLKQIIEKNNRKIEFFISLFKSNEYLELPKDLVATSKIEDFKLEFDEQGQDVVKFYSDILQRHSSYIDVIKKQNDQINKLKDITSQTIENLYELDTVSSRALSINEVREKMDLQNLTVNAENEKHLTQQLIDNYKLNHLDVIKLENMAKDILNDEEISSAINQFNTDRKKFLKTKIESDNAMYDDWFYNNSFLWSDLIDLVDNKNGMETYDILQKIYKNSDYDTDIFDISEYPLFLFAYLISMSDNYQEYSEIINRMVANNKDLEKIFNALQSIIIIANPELTKDRTYLNEIGCADMKLIDFSLLRKTAQFITTQYFNNIYSNIKSMRDKCRLDEYKNDIKSAKNIDNKISELEEKENEIRKTKLLNEIIKLQYQDTDKSMTLDELINGISYNPAAVYQLKKSDKSLVDTIDDELNKFKYEMNNKINEMKMKQCANIAKNNFIDSGEFNNLKTENKLYQNLISENQNLMTRYSDQDKINDIKGNKMLIDILKKELGLGDIKKRNLFDAIIKYEDYDQHLFNVILNDKVDDQIEDSAGDDLKINNSNINNVYDQNKISNDESFPFEDENNNDKVDKMSKDFIKNHFQDMNQDNSFKLSFSQAMNLQQNKISNDEPFPFEDGNNNNKVDEMSPKQMENPFQDMNLKQDNIAVKRSLFDKINSRQSNNNIPDMNDNDTDKSI